MKKQISLLFGLGALAFLVGNTNYNKTPKVELDGRYIVRLNTPLEAGADAVAASQKQFKKDLRQTIGFDFKVQETFSNALNAVVIDINSKDVKLVESLPNVTRVTKDEVYFFSNPTNLEGDGTVINETIPIAENTEDVTRNYSKETMNVPTTSNEGEGTLVAVLDSGFLINHNAFKGLPAGTTPKYTAETMKKVFTDNEAAHKKDPTKNPLLKAKWTEGVASYEHEEEFVEIDEKTGKEKTVVRTVLNKGDHNTYFNSKIAFQYDYAGELYTNVKDGVMTYWTPDPDYTGEGTKYIEVTKQEQGAGFSLPDGNAYSPYSDHGTHVAGIVAAHDETSYTGTGTGVYDGIAPKAQLALMKVFTDYIPRDGVKVGEDIKDPQIPGTGASDLHILRALEDCVILDVDVINMSLGQDLNDFDNKSESFRVFGELRNKGILVNVSAGNNGRQLFQLMGPYKNHLLQDVETGTLGSYANSEDVLTIASGNLEIQHFEKAFLVDGNAIAYDDQASREKNKELNEDLPFKKLLESGNDTFDFVFVPDHGTKDSYEKYGIDPKGKIVVTERGGGVRFTEMIINAKHKKALGIIIINDDPGATDFNMRMDLSSMDGSIGIPVAMVLNKDLPYLKESQSNKVAIIEKKDIPNPNAGKMSEFSTDGATYDLRLKPEITAPGSVIKGPIPGKVQYPDMDFAQDQKAYDWLSGTSMSAPNYTGATALLLSEFKDPQERRAYAKTLPARTMSTADIKFSEAKGEKKNHDFPDLDGTPYSPRRQGAGYVDVTEARSSKLYLEGAVENKAKIELFNTEAVSKGLLDLNFKIYNESKQKLTFTPKVYVMRPDIITYNEKPTIEVDKQTGKETIKYDNPEWLNKELQSINDKLIDVVTLDNIQVGAETGAQEINLKVQVKADLLKYIDEKFPSGTYLEGYVVLTPTEVKEGVGELNIPYMGFYGDYFKLDAVEEFDFERKEGEFLGSDLIHTLAKRINVPEAYYGSTIRGTGVEQLQKDDFYTSMNQMWMNTQGLDAFTKELKFDSNQHALHVGAKGQTDLLVAQLFVNRSIESTKFEIFRDDDEKLDKTNYAEDVFGNKRPRFYTPLYGPDSDSIAKSMATAGFLNGILAHRAYALIPVSNLKDGMYTLKMTFNTQAGKTMEGKVTSSNPTGVTVKEVKLLVDSTAPEVHHTETYTAEGTSYLRVYVTEDYLKSIKFNNRFTRIVKQGYDEEKGLHYADCKLDDIFKKYENGKFFVTIEDDSYNESKFFTNVTKDGKISYFLSANWAVLGDENMLTSSEFDQDGTHYYKYTLKITDRNNADVNVTNAKRIRVILDVSNFDLTKDLNVYRIDEDTNIPIRIKDYTIDKDLKTLSFETKGNVFAIEGVKTGVTPVDPDTPDVPVDPEKPVNPDNKKEPNLGLILGLSIPGGIIGIAGIAALIVFLVKRF